MKESKLDKLNQFWRRKKGSLWKSTLKEDFLVKNELVGAKVRKSVFFGKWKNGYFENEELVKFRESKLIKTSFFWILKCFRIWVFKAIRGEIFCLEVIKEEQYWCFEGSKIWLYFSFFDFLNRGLACEKDHHVFPNWEDKRARRRLLSQLISSIQKRSSFFFSNEPSKALAFHFAKYNLVLSKNQLKNFCWKKKFLKKNFKEKKPQIVDRIKVDWNSFEDVFAKASFSD